MLCLPTQLIKVFCMCFSIFFRETLIPYSIQFWSSLEACTVKFAFSIVVIITTTFFATILRQEKFPPKLKRSAQSTLKRCYGFSVASAFSEIYPCIFLSLFTFTENVVYREYFMESAGVRYSRTSCGRIRNRRSERSERVRFLIQKQRVRKYRTKHFPCGIVFIIYILRHSSFWRLFYFKSFKNAKISKNVC